MGPGPGCIRLIDDDTRTARKKHKKKSQARSSEQKIAIRADFRCIGATIVEHTQRADEN